MTLIEEWATRLAQVVESMTGDLPKTKVEISSPPPDNDLLWWEQGFSSAPGALAWVGATAASWRDIGGRILRSAGVDDGTAEDLKSTYQEALNQSLSSLAQALSSTLRKEVLCLIGREKKPEGQSLQFHAVTLQIGESEIKMFASISQELLSSTESNAPKGEGKKAKAAVASAGSSSEAQAATPSLSKSLDLLLDVELPVSVSFGRAQLPLKEVIKLTTGSIVELNRNVSEPVEIIVNNCVIARGQVVVVEGYFGVRVQQVISRQERIRTLK